MKRTWNVAWRAAALTVLVFSTASTVTTRADTASDDRIRQRILMRLNGQVALHIESLGVEVSGAKVRLTGSVGSLGEKNRAERVVNGIVGVNGIANDLSIKQTDRSEIAIAQDVQRHLGTRTRFRRTPITVTVSGTEVTLSGTVERALDRLDAEEIASEATGVTRVIDNLQLKGGAAVPASSIRTRVLSVLTNPLTFGLIRQLEVTVEEDGTVTLKGVATRDADRAEAERLALGVPGVTGVNNLISVAGNSGRS